MDPLIKKRLLTTVIVHPFERISRGDKIFGSPYLLRGYLQCREKVEQNPTGSDSMFYTYIILDGQEPTPTLLADIVGFLDINKLERPVKFIEGKFHYLDEEGNITDEVLELCRGQFVTSNSRQIQFAIVKPEDDIEVPDQPRQPITTVRSYQGLVRGTQNVEVII